MNLSLQKIIGLCCITQIVNAEKTRILDHTSAVFQPSFPGSSSIHFDYNLDDSTVGSVTSESDFYVTQSIGAHGDCDTPITDAPFVVDPQPTFRATSSITTLVNSAKWLRGETSFCLRLKLWKWSENGSSYLIEQKDTSFAVDIEYTPGSVELTAPVTLAPIIIASLPSNQPYSYGSQIPINLAFNDKIRATYDVDPDNIFLIDQNNEIMNNRLESATFTRQSVQTGTLEVTLPLSLYEMGLESVRILVPLEVAGEQRRNLRTLLDNTLVFDEIVEIRLSPLEFDEEVDPSITQEDIASEMNAEDLDDSLFNSSSPKVLTNIFGSAAAFIAFLLCI